MAEGSGRRTRTELEAEIARLAGRVAELEAALGERDERIARLEALVEEVRRGQKRQGAPFSKGEPVEEAKRPGRKSGGAHGRHGHREMPDRWDRTLEAPLPGCLPALW